MAEVIAQTKRLILRTWDDEDEFRFYDVMNTPPVMRWLGGVQDPEEWSAGFQRLRGYDRDWGLHLLGHRAEVRRRDPWVFAV